MQPLIFPRCALGGTSLPADLDHLANLKCILTQPDVIMQSDGIDKPLHLCQRCRHSLPADAGRWFGEVRRLLALVSKETDITVDPATSLIVTKEREGLYQVSGSEKSISLKRMICVCVCMCMPIYVY